MKFDRNYLLLGLVILLVLIGCAAYVLYQPVSAAGPAATPTPGLNATPTATSVATVSPTVEPTATPTATPAATPAATATPTAQASVSPTPVYGWPLYNVQFGPAVSPTPTPDPIMGTISGRVINGWDHTTGLHGIYAYVADGDGRPLSPDYLVRTDENGYYLISNLPLGSYSVYISYSENRANNGEGSYVGDATLTTAEPDATMPDQELILPD